LPGRRKNKKSVAPTPPDVAKQLGSVNNSPANKETVKFASAQLLKQFNETAGKWFVDNILFQKTICSIFLIAADEDCKSLPHINNNQSTSSGDKMTKFGSHDNLLKMKEAKIPPARPQPVNAECQTLTRMKNHQKPNCDSSIKEPSSNTMPPLPGKPVAAPRPSLRPTSSGGNDDDNSVTIREKPAIPERPVALMRPPSFKGVHSESTPHTSSPTLKKAQSFRGESTGSGHTVLERTQIYNIDKQQVSIIDVVDPTSTGGNGHHQHHHREKDRDKDKNKELEADTNQPVISNNLRASQTSLNELNLTQVPASPRGFDSSKVKRPQVPAPPPPTSRPKSVDSSEL
jgi:hypothetical protein